MSPGQCRDQAVLVAATKAWTARKWDGFCSPVSSYLPLVSLWRARSGNKFLTRWNTSVFLTQQGSEQSNDRTTCRHQVRLVRKVTGRPPHEHHGQSPVSMLCSLAEPSFLPPACACSKQWPSVWAGGEWAEGHWHGSACSFHHSRARLRSPQKVHSPPCHACPQGGSASAEAAAHS